MPPRLPSTDSPLIRTSDKDAWAALLAALENPSAEGFKAYIIPVDDPSWRRISAPQAAAQARTDGVNALVLFIADDRTLEEDGFPVLVVDLAGEGDAEEAEGDEGGGRSGRGGRSWRGGLESDGQGEQTETTPPRTLRCVASELWSIDNNLNLANMGWEDFADELDADGVFRGFERTGEMGAPAPPVRLGAVSS